MKTDPVVLYVEDDSLSRKVIELLLVDQMGLSHVHIFEDSADFIARVEQLSPQPEVIFLDIHMKPLTGFQMLAILRQHSTYKHLPVVALTASVMSEEVRELETAGFDGCISKPISIAGFPDIFARILKGEKVWRIIQ